VSTLAAVLFFLSPICSPGSWTNRNPCFHKLTKPESVLHYPPYVRILFVFCLLIVLLFPVPNGGERTFVSYIIVNVALAALQGYMEKSANVCLII
jgi:hypothetical protein